MSQLDQQIGRRLRLARKACGYKSARSFASKFNIPESTYSQHETGKRSLSPELLLFYGEKLAINIGWLITGPDDALKTVGLLNAAQETPKIIPLLPEVPTLDFALLKKIYIQAAMHYFDNTQRRNALNLLEHTFSAYQEALVGLVASGS